jgi:adenylosuccinate synthase
MRKEGREFGATTGRPRRCGWLDLPALKYAVMLNGVTQLVMMKVDVLTVFDTIRVCTHYRLPDGTLTDQLPYDLCTEDVEPIYRDFEGWMESLEGIRTFEDMPATLTTYVEYLENELNIPISFVSTGPNRDELIHRGTEKLVG